jgi:hypothetical protein
MASRMLRHRGLHRREAPAAVPAPLPKSTAHLADFRTGVPEYTEYLDPFPAAARARNPPRELVPCLREKLRDQVEPLARDTAAATGNVRASAELRQAVANTRLQRVTICLTIAAAAIAVVGVIVATISLVVALHAVRH